MPLALALLNISHPDMPVIDQLSRLTHDADADVAQSAIMVSEEEAEKLGGVLFVLKKNGVPISP